MNVQGASTLVNPQNGNLAFKVFGFKDNSHFDHIQRNNFYSLIFITKGQGSVKADFTTYPLQEHAVFSFSPYQPFMFDAADVLDGTAVYFHPDFFCIHKHQQEVACIGVLFNNIYKSPQVQLQDTELELLLGLVNDLK